MNIKHLLLTCLENSNSAKQELNQENEPNVKPACCTFAQTIRLDTNCLLLVIYKLKG